MCIYYIMQIKVFDTSAFLNRFNFQDFPKIYTTNSVINEILTSENKFIFENLIIQNKIQIQDPKKETILQIKKKSPKSLSKTDIEVLALAFELKAELHTDDFMIRKIARDLKIKIKETLYEIKLNLDKIYNKIKPSEKELKDIENIKNEIIPKIEAYAKKNNIKLKKVLLAGSSARGTFIHNSKDMDIFLLFDLSLSINEIKTLNEIILNNIFPNLKFIEEYGEHPYLKTTYKNQNIDFVPGFYIKDIKDKKSSVDRTPLHLEFLNKNQNKETKKQVILLKQFLKNNLLYGADQKNNGFSGYLTELFILKFKTFENCLKAFAKLEDNKKLTLTDYPKKKFDDYLIFIDPTDINRNVASAVSKKNWLILQKISKEYLENKTEKFFFENYYNTKLSNIIVFEINIIGTTPDTNWGIIKSIATKLKNELNNKNYNIINYSGVIENNKGYVIFQSDLKNTLRGPILNDLKNAKLFKKKHPKAYTKDLRLYCDIKFTKTEIITDIKKMFKKNYPKLKFKLSNINNIKNEINRVKKDFFEF